MANSHQIPTVVPFSEGTRPKLLDQVRHAIRMRHYSRRTEKTYADWIRRFIIFHHKKHPKTMGAPEITAFLSWLATTRRVSASTQNQALSAVLFLYRHVLRIEVDAIEQVPRARLPDRVPVVLSREEVDQIFAHLQGTMWLVAALLYGAGLRLQECLELRLPPNSGCTRRRPCEDQVDSEKSCAAAAGEPQALGRQRELFNRDQLP